jgi:hypothetical protein
MSVLIVPSALAQYERPMSVGINMVNLDTVNQAEIVISFYPEDGSAPTEVPDTIPAGGATKYFPIPVSDGFNGSAVVSSSTEVAVIVNEISDYYAGAYNGFSEGSTSFYAPIIMRNNGGYNTEISIQNAGSETATVDVSFLASTYGNNYDMTSFTIEPSRVTRVFQGDQTQLGDRFVGSATVTSNEPVVITVNQINNGARTLLVYDGFSSGYERVAIPQVQHNNANYNTGIQVQNVGAQAATVTVTYGPNVKQGGTAFTPGPETAQVDPGETAVFNQWGNNHGYNWNAAPTYVGAAVVTSDIDMPLVVNVNVLRGTAPAQASAYEGIDADSTATEFSAPILMSNNGGFSTSCLVLNTNDDPLANDVDVTMSFTPNAAAGITWQPTDEQFTLESGASNQFRQFPTLGQWAADNGGARWVGSGEITATGPVAVVCNQLNFNASSSDGLLSYIAFPLDLD